MHRRRSHGFTLIELLVVIAIIALLIGILLPALGRARTAGQLAVSLSNQRQIMLANEQYRNDNDGFMPWYQLEAPQWIGFCPWAYGGKHNDDYWRNRFTRLFDVAAHERVLNPYMYPEVDWNPETAGLIRGTGAFGQTRWTPTPVQKERLQLPAYRSPGDKIDYMQKLIDSSENQPTANEFGSNSYDFVGTSYFTNLKWWQLIRSQNQGGGVSGFTRAFDKGMRRFKTGADFDSSRFMVMTDEVGVPIYYLRGRDNPQGLVNGFGDLNKSVTAFFDGHAKYITLEFGAFRTKDYTLVFTTIGDREDLEDLEEEYQ